MAAAPLPQSPVGTRRSHYVASARFDWLAYRRYSPHSPARARTQRRWPFRSPQRTTECCHRPLLSRTVFHTIGILLRNRNGDSSAQRILWLRPILSVNAVREFLYRYSSECLAPQGKTSGRPRRRRKAALRSAFSVKILLSGATRINSPPSSPPAPAGQSLGSRRREKRTLWLKRRAPAPGTRPCLSSQCFAERSTLLPIPCMLVLRRQSIRHFPA